MSKKFTPTPHDAVFKQFLSEKETAKDFFYVWLPGEIKALCDLDSLKVESGSFIDVGMKNYQSDILYSVNTHQGQGYVYLLIEHQSTPDKLIAWRLMRYSLAAMQKHLEAGHKQLPLVFPILFYCGEQSPHPYSTNWLDCFEDRKLAESIYTNPFKLADVTTLDDGEIMQHGVSLDIENYCTLRLFFNQTQLLYRRPECDKPGKYCSLSRLPFRGC